VFVEALSTPKLQAKNGKFLDDSLLRFTSPELGTRDVLSEMNTGNDDFSRRCSIDSFSRNQANATMVMPTFNRFNTISENEFEEPSINQKFLQASNEENGSRRLSTLQIRNQQSKPHLKSSYPLELVLPAVTENQIRGAAHANEFDKENARVSWIFVGNCLNE